MKELTNSNFDEATKIGASVVDFWASWCGPCRKLQPILEEISADLNNVNFFKVNVDDYPELATKFSVMSLPSVFVFVDGSVVKSFVGWKTKEAIIDLIQGAIG